MNNAKGWRNSIRRLSEIVYIKKIKPGDLLNMAIEAMESSKTVLKRNDFPIVPNLYTITLPGEKFDEFIALKEILEKRIASQLRAYAADAGYSLYKNQVEVTIIRMPSTRRGKVSVETFFLTDTDPNDLKSDEPEVQVRRRFDGDPITMVFGGLDQHRTWKDNYSLSCDKDLDVLHEVVRFIDAQALEQAGELLNELLVKNPSHNGLWILNDYLRYRQKDGAVVDKMRSRALLVKNDPLLSSALAIMLLEDGKPEEALWEILETLNAYPDNPIPALVLAQTYVELEMPNLASERIRFINLQNLNDPEIPDLMRRYITRTTGSPQPEKQSSRFFRLLYHQSMPIDEPGKRELINTRKTQITIGRASGSAHPDVALCDGKVSSIHCRIVYSSGLFYVVDCDSRNGVYVNGKKKEASRLESGDVLEVGDTKLVFET